MPLGKSFVSNMYNYVWLHRLVVSERQKYVSRVRAAMNDLEKDNNLLSNFDHELEDFEINLTKTLDVYLEYLRSFVTMIQVKIK